MTKSALTSDTPFPRNYAREVIQFSHGSGAWLTDANGIRYLDLGSGIAVNALGYGDRRLARIVHRQMKKLVHVSNLYATAPALELGRRLLSACSPVGSAPFTAVHFGNSGAEANEAAIKYARLYSRATRGPEHHTIISFSNAFHGRTMGALSATPKTAYRTKFEPLLPGFESLPFNDVSAVRERLGSDVAAVIVEVVQGEGGLEVISPEMVEALNELCAAHDIVLIADEIQTGLGRLGTLLGSEAVGLRPDIVTLSKPLAGGLPLSATLLPARINDHVEPGDHGTTFGGGPVTSAAALYVLERLERDGFLATVQERATQLNAALEELKRRFAWITELRGTGMLRGIRLDLGDQQDELFAQVVPFARDAGLLVLRSGADVVRIAPPLIISRHDLARGMEKLSTVFDSINARRNT